MKSIKEITEYSWVTKKSEFICTLIPCDDESKIEEIIQHYKEKYQDASHNCVAYIVNNKEKANDDGEPSKTAGMPMLNVLKRQELTNVIAIVTRYFGGIKLGAGGLTRAYTQSVVDALKQATIVEKHPVAKYNITIDYPFTKKFEHLIKTNHIRCLQTQYLEKVMYTCYIENDEFFSIIQDLTNNTYKKELLQIDYIEI